MPSLLYSPGVQVRIFTARDGIIDVSEDIEDGEVNLGENRLHTARITLANPGRKYDGVFTPNDRISIAMKRIRWVQVFTGYLNKVPFFSAFPRPVSISASCSLKQVQYTMWDKQASASVEYLNSFPTGEGDDTFVARAVGLLTHPLIGRWDESRVHVGRLPDNWSKDIDALIKDLPFDVPDEVLGTLPVIGGVSGGLLPGYTQKPINREATEFHQPGLGYGDLPARTGKVLIQPTTNWRIQMRWPYLQPIDSAPYAKAWLTADQERTAREWWTDTRLLVINPATNQAVCCEVDQWGPPTTAGRPIGLNSDTFTALAAGPDDSVFVRFAPLGTPLGPFVIATPPPSVDPTPGIGVTPGVTATTTINSSGSPTWTSAEKLKPNCNAARTFIRNTWGASWGISGWRDASSSKDKEGHPLGLALDVMVSNGGEPTAEGIAYGNAVAMWFLQNPDVFGTKYVIWYERINSRSKRVGWRQYEDGAAERNPSKAHRNHVHITFENNGRTSPGPMGGALPGSSPSDFQGGFATNGVINGIGPAGGPVTTSFDWAFARDPESDALVGPRALMNDNPLLPDIGELLNTGMRSWCSAPNGDFISWFPDYFGLYGLAAKMIVRSIELKDFTIDWDDERLKTHQYVSGAWGVGYGSPYSAAYTSLRRANTFGIVTVEMPNVMKKLLNVPDDDKRGWGDGEAILKRFGARPEYTPMSGMADERGEFWYALYRFQRNWAEQFSCVAPVTFMPELFPGMIMALADYGVQFYVRGVTHRFSFADGGGFHTDVDIIAPSAVDGSGFFGLPRAAPIIDPTIVAGEME